MLCYLRAVIPYVARRGDKRGRVTLSRVQETPLAVERNKYYTLLCTCVCVCVRTCARTRGGGEVKCGCRGVGVFLSACSFNNPARKAPAYCHLRPLWFHRMFRHYLINGTVFGKESLKKNVCFDFLYNFRFKHFPF